MGDGATCRTRPQDRRGLLSARRPLAGRYHRRAVAHSATLQNRRSVGIAHLGLAHHQLFQLADFDAALTNYTRAAEECRHAGDLRSRMGATLMLAEVTALTGNLAASPEP